VRVLGSEQDYNQALERAGRVADFLEFAELMCIDALERNESAGAHFRQEHQTPDGEALRDDENHAAVFAWELQGDGQRPKLHREPLHFEIVHLAQRSSAGPTVASRPEEPTRHSSQPCRSSANQFKVSSWVPKTSVSLPANA